MHDNLDTFRSGRRARVTRPEGVRPATPAVVMIDPKYPHNVGAAVRAASCWGVRQIWYTGERVALDAHAGYRLPREERMRGYRDVDLFQYDAPLDVLAKATPVAVEVRPNSERLPDFEHPENAVYVFGPEDGSIPPGVLARCHRFVIVPTRHCLNLGAAINVILYDRCLKRGFPDDAGWRETYGEGWADV
ncbi:MAG: TrmH family RNA methyltransferase [Alphaproteobacteria bacterium]|nr:TrmH family RNA methyltransferase [Alphaproteobacteria bacterium]